jgi:hypothetical protein
MNTQTTLVENPVNRKLEVVNSPTRRGKVARLPKPTRDMINRMLDDGLPYHVIIDELGEAGQGLNIQNLSNWKHGGYQDWLKHQELLEKCRLEVEYATELLQQLGADASQIQAACQLVAALQVFTALKEHGEQALKDMLQTRPANILRLIHTTCALSHSGLKTEKHALLQSLSNQIKVNQASPISSFGVPASAGPSQPASQATTPAAGSNQIKPNQASPLFPSSAATSPAPACSNPQPTHARPESNPINSNQASQLFPPAAASPQPHHSRLLAPGS